jgi:hypothetical protein
MRNRSPRIALLLAAVAAMVWASCGFILKVKSSYDPKADFAALHTYTWLPKKMTAPRDPRVDNEIVNAKVHDSANGVLAQKGYTQVSGGVQPDFLISYHVTTADVPGDDNIPNYWGYYPIWQGGIGFYQAPVENGTLVIDIIDPKTHYLLWRGTGERQLVENDSPSDRIHRLEKGVREIIEQFPPKS